MKELSLFFLLISSALTLPSIDPRFEGKRLIQFTKEGPPVWLSLEEIDKASSSDINFMDVTDAKLNSGPPPKLFDIPTTIRFRPYVNSAFSHLSMERIQEFIVPLTEYHNRYYTTTNGVHASNWILTQVQNAITASGYTGSVTASQFIHADWAQPSVTARIQGRSPETVILGAHLDSINGGANGLAPGADDNASGSATILETFRALLESQFIPTASIEFHWYAAEEVGLRGSQDIAQQYKAAGREVIGMINFDMTAYQPTEDLRVAIITDFTDPELSQFLRMIVDAYSNYGRLDMECGYACSDHASWNRSGYRSARQREGVIRSPYLHTTSDTLATLTYRRILEYARIAAGFAVELAQPQ